VPAPGLFGDADPGFEGVVDPGGVVPGALLFGTPFGEVEPGVFGFCGLVSGLVLPAGGVAVPAGGVAVPAGGVAVPAGGVAVPAGGVAVLLGVVVPAGGVAAPGVELCPAVPEPPAGAVPPAGELCATTQLAQQRITDNNVIFVIDIFLTSDSEALGAALFKSGRPTSDALVIGCC